MLYISIYTLFRANKQRGYAIFDTSQQRSYLRLGHGTVIDLHMLSWYFLRITNKYGGGVY